MSDVNIQTISVSPTVLSGLEYLVLLNGSETEDLIVQIDGASDSQILESKQLLLYILKIDKLEWASLVKVNKHNTEYWSSSGKPSIKFKIENNKLKEASIAYGTMGGFYVKVTEIAEK